MSSEGKFQVPTAVPQTPFEPIVINGQRGDLFQSGRVGLEYTDRDQFWAYFEGLAADKTERVGRAAKKAAAKNKNSGNHESVDDNGENGEDDDKPRKNTANMPHSRQAIPAGITFDHPMSLSMATDLDLGMLLATFAYFSEDAQIGARCGMNCGIVNMSYEVITNGERLGQFHIDGRKRQIEMSPTLEEYVGAFWEAFPTLDFSVPDITK
jgi:hypothetical protein